VGNKPLVMGKFYFNGSTAGKLDEKNRFVLPQEMRYGLIEEGELSFTIALGLGGCLAIYRKSDIDKIVDRFRTKMHLAKYQKFFTLFFSTLHTTTCDKIGRVTLPAMLKSAANIKGEIVIAGVLNKIEIWPKDLYDYNLKGLLEGKETEVDFAKLAEEAFALLDEREAVEEGVYGP